MGCCASKCIPGRGDSPPSIYVTSDKGSIIQPPLPLAQPKSSGLKQDPLMNIPPPNMPNMSTIWQQVTPAQPVSVFGLGAQPPPLKSCVKAIGNFCPPPPIGLGASTIQQSQFSKGNFGMYKSNDTQQGLSNIRY